MDPHMVEHSSYCWSFPGDGVTVNGNQFRIGFHFSRFFSGCKDNDKPGCSLDTCGKYVTIGGKDYNDRYSMCMNRFAQIHQCKVSRDDKDRVFDNVGGTYWDNCVAFSVYAQETHELPPMCGDRVGVPCATPPSFPPTSIPPKSITHSMTASCHALTGSDGRSHGVECTQVTSFM